MKSKQSSLLLILLLLSLGCSRLPHAQYSQSYTKSTKLISQGILLEKQGKYIDALDCFTLAKHYAKLGNEIELLFLSLQGQIRITVLTGSESSYDNSLQEIRQLNDLYLPAGHFHYHQILLWIDFIKGNYKEVLSNYEKVNNAPPAVKIECLSLYLQSAAAIELESSNSVKDMQNLLKKYKKNTKLIQPDLLSNAYYSLAYYHYSRGSFTTSVRYLSKAIALDKKNDFYTNLADDYYLMGKNWQKLQNINQTNVYLSYAKYIYQELGNTQQLQKIDKILETNQ